ncbi:MAG: SoxR reducing system RseC family protein [Chitinispirillales bacterium]|jgi:hypothetical protein|nr:SoxR reducing system RseC family protein [Chitinispirillales bacterium]
MFQFARKDSGEGVVCAIGRGQVFVAPVTLNINPSPAPPKKECAPGGCGKCGGCLALVSTPNGYARKFAVPVDEPMKYKLGERVLFARFIPEPNLMSAVVFGIPVAFALAVILYWLAAAPESAESHSAAFSVGAAFFTGILVSGAFDRLFKKKYPPVIISAREEAARP